MQVYSRSQNKTKQTHGKTNETNTRPAEHTKPRQADHRCCRRTGWHFRGGMAHMGSPTSGDTSPNSLLKDRNVGGFPHHHQQFKKKRKKKESAVFAVCFHEPSLAGLRRGRICGWFQMASDAPVRSHVFTVLLSNSCSLRGQPAAVTRTVSKPATFCSCFWRLSNCKKDVYVHTL